MAYYSAWDYFSSSTKFRTLAFQPELRYWFRANDGWFVGGHFSLAYYNLLIGDNCRIQDKGGNTPAVGGGLSGGYRFPISRNGRLHLEFALGAGVYQLHYDKFRDDPNGLLLETKKKTYVGLDNAAVNFSYTFNKKKGGRK